MPELPEVITIINDLRKRVVNCCLYPEPTIPSQTFREINGLDPLENIHGKEIIAVERLGKYIIFVFRDLQKRLVIHLGMSGQLFWSMDKDFKHSRMVCALKKSHGGSPPENGYLIFSDARRFGVIFYAKPVIESTVFGPQSTWDNSRLSKLGPDALEITPKIFVARMACKPRWLDLPIKATLLDQEFIAGIGNIYANEILFHCNINPYCPGRILIKTNKATDLVYKIIGILEKAIDLRGSSTKDYVDGNGKEGRYQLQHMVYGRNGLPCKQCTKTIIKVEIYGRSTFYCEFCQKQ